MRHEALAPIWDAREAGRAAHRFIAEMTAADFLEDLLVRSAVERQLEVLGEALMRLRRIDPETAERVPDIHRIIGMRNIIAHEYGEIDHEIVWAAATVRVPPLLTVFDALLAEAESR